MKTMRFWAIALGVVSLITLQPTAQQAKPQNAQQVLDRMAQTMGFAQAAKFRTIQLTGTMEYQGQNLRGRFESFYKSPDKFLLRMNIERLGEVQQGYDGKVGWEKNPMTGLRQLQGAELEQIRQSARTGAGNDLRRMLRNPRLQGQQKLGDRNAFVINAQSTTGSPVKLFIDAQRYLPLRLDMEAATPQGKINTTTLFEDFRKVDGVTYAFTTRQSTGNIVAVLKVERVRHNAPIDDAIFRMPKN